MITTANHTGEDRQWLRFAASPTFTLMMAVSTLGEPQPSICGAGADLSPFNSMMMMYLLMAFFHLPPWLQLARRQLTSKGD